MVEKVVYLDNNKENKLGKILKSYKINFSDIKLEEDKYFDNYYIKLDLGVKFNKIQRALPDIGLHLQAISEPKGSVLYDKGLYKISVHKKDFDKVTFEEVHKTRKDLFAPITLGMKYDGSDFIVDLQRLPNLLLGGVPGSGKSVLLHSMILSLAKANSDLFLIDPKMVEFNIYSDLAVTKAVVNSVEDSEDIIEHVLKIVESRFKVLSKSGARDIYEYNFLNKKSKKKMRPVVIVIDEWADLILQNKKVQKPLCVIAQKGRAAGVSIILATQRPSRQVISGLIKANFSGRICLRVASGLESRIILDCSGGEKISSVGEGLYLDQGLNEPILFRAPYIKSPSEISDNLPKKKKKTLWEKIWR